MKKCLSGLFFLLIAMSLFSLEPYFATDPAVSADGSTVCFCYQGDLWLVPFQGGEAKRITVTDETEYSPLFSPDNKYLAFNSNRDGRNNIYIIDLKTFIVSPMAKEEMTLCDWYNDSQYLLVCGSNGDRETKFFKMPIDGKIPVEISAFADSYASLSPDNKKIVFNKKGDPYREKYQGSTNGELYEYDIISKKFKKLTNTPFTERYPVYSTTRKNTIYFAAAEGDLFQIFEMTDGNYNKKALTKLNTWSARDLSIARQKERLTFEHFNQIWGFDYTTKEAKQIPVTINQDCVPSALVKETAFNRVDRFAVSPNGDWFAFCYKFDLFAIPEKGGEVKQITFDQAGIGDVFILRDNRTILFTKAEKGDYLLYKVSLDNLDKIELIPWSKGKNINGINYANAKTLSIYYNKDSERTFAALTDSTLTNFKEFASEEYIKQDILLSEDGKHAIYSSVFNPQNYTNSINYLNMETKEKQMIYKYDHYFWICKLADKEKSLIFNRGGNICRLDFNAKDDFYNKTDNWKEILNPVKEKDVSKDKEKDKSAKAKPEKAKNEFKIDFNNIESRVTAIVTREGWSSFTSMINDTLFYYVNSNNDKITLRKADIFGKTDESVCTLDSWPDSPNFNTKTKKLFFKSNNSLAKVDGSTGKKDTYSFTFKYSYDKYQLNKSVFEFAWKAFQRGFYDPKMHGVDWDSMHDKYIKYFNNSFSTNDLESIMSEMIGEVNASHTGFYARNEDRGKYYQLAYGGFILDYKDFPSEGIKFKKIFKDSKLNLPGNIKAGDILLEVDHKPVGKNTSVTSLFVDKVGQEIELKIKTADSLKTVVIKGLSGSENRDMSYANWVWERSEMVNKWSNGKIGYLHIEGMNNECYDKFVQDLFANNIDKESVVIDVRDNGGGYIHDRLIEALTKKSYGYSTNREFDAQKLKTPGNIWEKPMVLLINEDSFSDAEIFPHLFKELKLGKVVGMPTSGSVIGTGSANFMDGSSMRMPGSGWYLLDKSNMEGSGAQPDVMVDLTPEQIVNDDDAQLRTAVEILLKGK